MLNIFTLISQVSDLIEKSNSKAVSRSGLKLPLVRVKVCPLILNYSTKSEVISKIWASLALISFCCLRHLWIQARSVYAFSCLPWALYHILNGTRVHSFELNLDKAKILTSEGWKMWTFTYLPFSLIWKHSFPLEFTNFLELLSFV